MKITTKAEFFRMWKAGLLGNRTQLWDDSELAWRANCREYGFREQGKAGGGAWERVKRDRFWETVRSWDQHHRVYTMDDVVPDEWQTIQGEVCRTYRGLQGFIGASHLPMRKAAELGILKHRSPVETFVLLNTYMDPSSRDDLDDFLEMFPDATIEFTCFSHAVGVLRRQTMFWEIRDY